MVQHEITFTLETNECIKILLPKPLDKLFRYDEITITFCGVDAQKYVLFINNFAIYALRRLYNILQKAVAKKLHLHESITKDIGYIWNRLMWGGSKYIVYYTAENNIRYWVGDKHLLWCTPVVGSWLYEQKHKVYFEITPLYDWPILKQAKTQEGYISYRTFMKNYTPYLIREIAKIQIEEWLKQTEELLLIIEENDNKYRDILDAMPVYKLSPQTGQNNN